MSKRSTGGVGELVRGWLATALIPLVVLADSVAAVWQGWNAASAGTFGLVPKLMTAWLLVATLGLLSGGYRAWLCGRGSQLLTLAVSMLLGCGLAEAYLQVQRPAVPFHLRPPRVIYHYQPNSFQMPGVFEAATSTINSQGVRGPELPADRTAYRVLCVGGSGTECYYLDDTETWPAVMGRELASSSPRPIWVGAAGYSEHGLAQHTRFVRDGPSVDDVDCIVVLAGVNDLLQSVLGLDSRRDVPGPVWYRTRLVDLAKEFWSLKLGMGFVVDTDGSRIGLARLGREIPPRTLLVDQLLSDYEHRLRDLIDAAKHRHVRLVLVTQPVLWDDFLSTLGLRRLRWARAYPYPRTWEQLEAGALRALIEKYHQRLREVAADCGTELVDAAPQMTAIEMHFYDDFHLNETGCRTLGELLAESISVPAGQP